MNKYLLDTNICIHFLKNEYRISQQIAAVGFSNCYLSELTIAELLFGVANSAAARQEANRRAVLELRETFADRILLIGPAFEYYATQKVALRRMGRPVDDLDLLIGATAVANGLTLVTRNIRHFSNLTGVILQNWIDQPVAPQLRIVTESVPGVTLPPSQEESPYEDPTKNL